MILLIGSISVFAILGILSFAIYGLRSYRQMSQNLEKTTLYNETLQSSQEDLQAFRPLVAILIKTIWRDFVFIILNYFVIFKHLIILLI